MGRSKLQVGVFLPDEPGIKRILLSIDIVFCLLVDTRFICNNCCKLFNIVDMYSSFCHSLNKVCSHYILVFHLHTQCFNEPHGFFSFIFWTHL